MKREDFKKVVKLFSYWKIDKRKGNYRLPNGSMLKNYLEDLIINLLKNNNLAFAKNGNLYEKINFEGDFIIFIPFGNNEDFYYFEQERRIKGFIWELLN